MSVAQMRRVNSLDNLSLPAQRVALKAMLLFTDDTKEITAAMLKQAVATAQVHLGEKVDLDTEQDVLDCLIRMCSIYTPAPIRDEALAVRSYWEGHNAAMRGEDKNNAGLDPELYEQGYSDGKKIF